jgi:hypothetical protein
MPQFAFSNVVAAIKIGSTTYTGVVALTAPQISAQINEHTEFNGDGWVKKTAGVKNVGNVSFSIVYSAATMDAFMDYLTPAGSGYVEQAALSCELIMGADAAYGKFTWSGYIASITPPPSGSANEDAVIQVEMAVSGPFTFVPPT